MMSQSKKAQKGRHKIKPKMAPLKKKPDSPYGSIRVSIVSLATHGTDASIEAFRVSSITMDVHDDSMVFHLHYGPAFDNKVFLCAEKKYRIDIRNYVNLTLVVADLTTKIRSLLLFKSAGVMKNPWRSGE